MNNRYETMKHLRDHLNELFQLCGVPETQVKVSPAPALIRLAERLIRDDALYSYLEGLDTQTGLAVREMEERRLDSWNNQQNETRIAELEQELEGERTRAREAEKKLSQELQSEKARVEQYRKEQLSAIQDLIALRDKLLLRKSWLEDQAPEEESAQKLVISQLREIARCLTNWGVEILEAGGAFDNHFQTAVETRPAENAEQDGQIAETFRPGYRFRDEVLRPQEVILFTAT